ncbi:hypothetical protein, partial [Flammeovirga sp. OC4]|uniref:hypothetical protein n=1 Tax=Flammeovirga sp. OC4 TaxID=1382345 RepID=UPI0005C4FE54
MSIQKFYIGLILFLLHFYSNAQNSTVDYLVSNTNLSYQPYDDGSEFISRLYCTGDVNLSDVILQGQGRVTLYIDTSTNGRILGGPEIIGTHSVVIVELIGGNEKRMIQRVTYQFGPNFPKWRGGQTIQRLRNELKWSSNWEYMNISATYNDINIALGSTTPKAKLHVFKEGDALAAEWSANHSIQIWGDDQDLQIGVDTENRVSYFQSVDHGTTTSNISLNARGGNVGIGTVSPTSRLFLKQSSEKSTSGLSIQDLATRTINIYGEGAAGRQVISTTGTNNPLAFIL